jgi:hypothetical protein
MEVSLLSQISTVSGVAADALDAPFWEEPEVQAAFGAGEEDEFQTALRAEMTRKFPDLSAQIAAKTYVLRDVAPTVRVAILTNVIARRCEANKAAAELATAHPLTARLLKAACVLIHQGSTIPCWYRYADGDKANDGIRDKACQLAGGVVKTGTVGLKHWSTQRVVEAPIERVWLNLEAYTLLDRTANEQATAELDRREQSRRLAAMCFRAAPSGLAAETGVGRSGRWGAGKR